MKFNILTPKTCNLPAIVIDFLNYMSTVRGKSSGTVEAYKSDLCLFFKFIKVYKAGESIDRIPNKEISDMDAVFISSITLSDFYAFMNYVTIERKNGARARARKTASIRSFFNYAVYKSRSIKDNPALELETPKISKTNPIYLTLDESKQLLSSIDGPHRDRDYAIIVLFLNCGLRLSELIGINTTDIKEDRLTVTGKGNKQRVVYLNKACKNALELYINNRPTVSSHCKALFVSQRKERISKRTVQYIVQKYINKSNIEGEGYSVHKLRHTAATLMYKYGNVDIRTLQQILGHENVSTTQIYTHVDNDKLRQAINSNPLSELYRED